MNKKKKSVYQQTQAVLCKNFLKKQRMKRQSLLEWGLPILLGLYMGLFSYLKENDHIPETPSQDLGRADKFNSSYIMVVYTPVSNVTQQIMNKTASALFLKERRVIGVPDKKSMDAIILENFPNTVGIIFNDTFSYKLMFLQGYNIPYVKEDFSAHCWSGYYGTSCAQALYWKRGFVTLQTAIDAAIIEITTNHSVMEELLSVTGINMKILPFLSKYIFQNEMFIFYCLIYFSPFIYFASLDVTKERKMLKNLMKMMGLQDSAFWLSWGLTYAGFIFFISILITIVITSTQIIVMTGFMVIFTLFFLFGLSLIALVFLMSVLLKKSSLTSVVVFLLMLFWGFVGFTALHKQLPSSLEWILSICSPFAFTAGLAQIIHLDYKLNGVIFPELSGESYIMTGTFSMLAFDGLFYLVLALYFDRILPYGNERRYSPLFFLNSSPCLQRQRTDYEVIEKEIDPEHSTDDCFEPIAPEFQGKEAIRIRNIKKEYKGKSGKVEALKDHKIFQTSDIIIIISFCLFHKANLYRNEACDPEKITSFINHHIPDAKLKTESKEKLVYTLPLERTSVFPDLFSDLDKCSGEGVVSYDVSMSTLSEVLAKLEGKSTIKQDFEQAEVKRDPGSLDEMEPACSSLPEEQKTVSDMALWRLQVCAIARLRFLKLKHGKKELLTLLLVFGIAILPLIVEMLLYAILNHNSDLEFKPELYFLSPGQLPKEPHTSLLIINNTESNIEDFIHALKHQNIVLEVDDFENRNGTDDLSYNGAIIVSGKQKDYRFSVVCNTNRLHCFPVLMNIVSNGLLGMFNLTKYIQTERGTLFSHYIFIWTDLPEGSLFLVLVVCSISPYIAMSSVSDYKNKAHSQLWTSGLYTSAYWSGQALVDINLYILILFATYLFFYLTSSVNIYLTSRIVVGLVVNTVGYAASLVFLTYVISFIFHKRRKNNSLWSFCFYVITVITFDFVVMHEFSFTTLITLMVFFPSLTISGFFVFVTARINEQHRTFEDKNYDLNEVDLLVCLIPYFQVVIFVFVLRCLEIKWGKKTMQKDPVFRISPQSRHARPNAEEPSDEDEDVQAERIRTATALTTSNIDEKPVIIASCLHKEYAGKKKCCFSKRKKKIAARNISFCVKKGEILGLLGPNGAGKSSSIRMISGITKPTAGEVELKGSSSVWGHQEDNVVRFLGYCPQENPLWPTLTVREHLEVYAAVKGLRKEDAVAAITRLVDAFKLQELLNVPVQKLTAGSSRTLCFVLSILGNSPVLLLDEPSTGLDPTVQQQMWQTIQAAIKNTEKGALLVTHYLAEAEAVCDRVAIMVSGRLRCIGSIKHLKSKFGQDYILELKMKEPSQVTLVHTEILKLFPQAARQERYSSFLAYQLPMADVHPLSQAFHRLEAVKHNFDLEEYSLSQCTLEQVFLELFKEQELGDFEEEVDTTMRWKLLSHSDDP
ncbi:ATP-binding cassette sub-family A member 6 [Trichechus manatus latirostris]|uniref:ATP-binding cassette sub-family A member 6 n=1 Tax=Trichechus manatus latirostris TaxID=127582 RepID=A0A2Y9QT44_TRIMA|nr:ATP-binding cassette sub-family A member 6 [Trichechus manatus latirostris]